MKMERLPLINKGGTKDDKKSIGQTWNAASGNLNVVGLFLGAC
jgi:hypothetical protein